MSLFRSCRATGGGRQNLPDSQSAPKLLHIPYPEVDNAEDGLKIILKEHPDIIITDMKMPVMDGIQL